MISIAEFIFLLPATALLTPPLLFFTFVALPFNILSAPDFASASTFFLISGVSVGALLGLVASWTVKVRGIERISNVGWLRVGTETCLAFGVVSGAWELSWIIGGGRNSAEADLFWALIVLPAMTVGVLQLIRLLARPQTRAM